MLRFFKPASWDVGTVSLPWGVRPSIYAYIAAHSEAGRRFSRSEERLPDETEAAGKGGLRWVPGALDGAFPRHGVGGDARTAANAIVAELRALTEKATNDRARRLYALLSQSSTIDYIDRLLSLISQNATLRKDRVRAVARWLATGAPDREPVKTAIAILGIVSRGEDRDLLITLGRHEEFTLYSVVALQHSESEPEPLFWELAQHVTGWGRIHIVERLASTNDKRIKEWLLRTGCRNDIMDEYTALICARAGDLLSALRRQHADDNLLKGAGDIIAALIRGGPAPGIEAYADGAEATEHYLRHLRSRDAGLDDFNVVVTIERFMEEDRPGTGDFAESWKHRASAICDHVRAIKARPDWQAKIQHGLSSDDRLVFWNAAEAAKALGIDTWDVYFQRVLQGGDDWYFVMQTDDAHRIDRVVELAETRLPLDDIASGAAAELGLGPEFRFHVALDCVLQDLRRFPGRGWPLIRAGLQSPVIRNRNLALRALAMWDRHAWPADAELLLRQAVKAEPCDDTRRNLQHVLAGEPLNELG